MNLVIFGLILIGCHTWAYKTDGYYKYADRNKIETILEGLKQMLKTGNESLGIPVLDPFMMEQLPIKLNEEMITLDALFTDVNVRGLSEYNVISGNFQIAGFKLTMQLSWPLITANTNYAMKGIVSDSFEIYGNGNIKASAHNFAFSTEINFGAANDHFHIQKIVSKISLESLEFKITGFLDDEETSELISSLVSDMVPQIIEDYQKQITERVNDVIKKQADGFLATKTIMEIIRIIM